MSSKLFALVVVIVVVLAFYFLIPLQDPPIVATVTQTHLEIPIPTETTKMVPPTLDETEFQENLEAHQRSWQLSLQARKHGLKGGTVWNLYRPTWRCRTEEIIGENVMNAYPTDGPKWICTELIPLPPQECLVLSLGIDGEVSFDLMLKKRYPHCEIHAFDLLDVAPSIQDQLNKAGIISHKHIVSGLNETLKTIGKLGKEVALLKMDIEGGEWSVLPLMLKEHVKVRQLQVELHSPHENTFVSLFDDMDRHGWKIFHREFNPFCGGCMEYALLNINSYPFYKPNRGK